jgi:cysteine synthase
MNTQSHHGYFPSPTVHLKQLFGTSAESANGVEIYAKLDNLQMSGSTKERTASSLLDGLFAQGSLQPGGTVVESTSGNLGMALARQCTLRGVHFTAVVDERANKAATQVMAAYGATVDLVPTPPDGNRLRARVDRVQELLREVPGAVTTNQYANLNNPSAHQKSTFPEICDSLGGAPDRLFIATSTAGTILGCLQAVTQYGAHTQVVAVDSENSALFGGESGERYLPGLGAGFETDISLRAHPHAIHRIPEPQMVRGARLLARREGILAGASTGALVAAVGIDLALADSTGANTQKWVFLVHDGGQPYLPTLYSDDWVEQRFGFKPVEETADNPFENLVCRQ